MIFPRFHYFLKFSQDISNIFFTLETAAKIIILNFLILFTSCKHWDPNLQYSSELNAAKRKSLSNKIQDTSLQEIQLKMGQSLSEVIKVMGNDYRILASLRNNKTNWLTIEFLNYQESFDTKNGTITLIFKNNILVKIQ